MLALRRVQGLALLGWLTTCYAAALLARRLWRRAGDRLLPGVHAHGSRLVLRYIQRHGALLIKIGQYVASRPDVFPLPYVDACGVLRDRVPPRSLDLLRPTLAQAYEGRVEDHLARIEPQALAAASFGQVHRAWLADGTAVAVKIQYPGLGRSVEHDLRLVRRTLTILRLALPGWPFAMIYDEVRRVSREEQDYLHEGTMADRLREPLRRVGLHVPRVLWEHSREKVLVMEFAPGRTFAAIRWSAVDPARRRRVADAVLDGFLTMLLEERLFHGDPHGGNLLFDERPDGDVRVWLLDFGMTAEIGPRDAALYLRFLQHLRADDTDGMADVLADLGELQPGVDRSDLRELVRAVYAQLGSLNPRTFKGSRRQAELSQKVALFLRRVRGVTFPRHTVLLSRASSLVEGLCMELVPGSNVLDLLRPRLDRYAGPVAMLRRQVELLRLAGRAWLDLPDRLLEAVRHQRPAADVRPVVMALLLIAALQLPEGPWRTWTAVAAGLALAIALLRLRR